MTRFACWVSLPAEPLTDAIDAHLADSGRSVRCHGEKVAQLYYKAKQAGRITAVSADRLAVEYLGRHPAEVYGDAWWALPTGDAHDATV